MTRLDTLCDVLASSVNALVTVEALARRLRVEVDDAADLVVRAVRAGRVEVWDAAPPDGEPAAILSSAEAQRRGLVLLSKPGWRPGRCKWIDRNRLPAERARTVAVLDAEGNPVNPDRITYQDIAPVIDVAGRQLYLVHFTAGSVALPWQAETERSGRPCPYCAGVRLRKAEMCLYCHRCPLDRAIGVVRVRPDGPKRPRGRPRKPLSGGTEKRSA